MTSESQTRYPRSYDCVVVNRARNLLEATLETVGPYPILERIDTGGMGEVYRSEQRTPIRREVALELIKLSMDTRRIIATGVAFTLLLFAVIGTIYGFCRVG